MVREIARPKSQEYTVHIPKEYVDRDVEILILPFSKTIKEKKEDLSKLLNISTWNIDEDGVKVKDWDIQTF